MKIASSAFSAGQAIPPQFARAGSSGNPSLVIADVPDAAHSLALVVHDPDAPSGDFTHWLLWNISPTTAKIDKGAPPPTATQGTNDFGVQQYVGPAPPSGTHRYVFDLYAVDADVQLPPAGAKVAELLTALQNHILTTARLIGTFTA